MLDLNSFLLEMVQALGAWAEEVMSVQLQEPEILGQGSGHWPGRELGRY